MQGQNIIDTLINQLENVSLNRNFKLISRITRSDAETSCLFDKINEYYNLVKCSLGHSMLLAQEEREKNVLDLCIEQQMSCLKY